MLLTEIIKDPISGILLIVALAFAIGVHEACHAFAANWLGDSTPRLQGRLTFNPLKHLDPMGSLFILIAGIGWGKPVMFNPYNLKNPHKDAAVIAVAGPISNILMSLLGLGLLYLLYGVLGFQSEVILKFFINFITINVGLAIFNMLPIDPLDGFKVVGGLLPGHLAMQWYETQRYGVIVLLVLFVTGALDLIINPIYTAIIRFMFQLLGA